MRIRLTDLAEQDLEAIGAYIARDNPAAATATVIAVLDAIETLGEYPNFGRPGRVPQTRELVIDRTPYIAVYQVRDGTVWVLRVLHGARRWP